MLRIAEIVYINELFSNVEHEDELITFVNAHEIVC